MNFSEIIKQCILQIINSIRFCDICVGEITSIKPLCVKIDEKLLLNSEHIVVSNRVSTSLGVDSNTSLDISLNKNKRIILIKESGGQKYYAIDFLAEKEE